MAQAPAAAYPKTRIVADLPRRPLRSHQETAVAKILATLSTSDRAQYIAACGSGKTLVGAHVAMALARTSVVVFLPSLALLRQTLDEWSREHVFNDNYSVLCVCSDESVTDGIDAIRVSVTDLGAPITTDNYLVKRFLSAQTSKTKIVFCTYQSAGVLKAGVPKDFAFDLGVFDEAHKTAGYEDKTFALALDDQNVAIRKRLFLTATQRHCHPRYADDEDLVSVYSMGSTEAYGPVADNLTLSEAIQRGLVCDYRAVISVVTSGEVNTDLLRPGTCLRTRDGRLDMLRVAHYLALRQAVRQHDVRKIFTFHGTIQEAKDFVNGANPGIGEYLPDFDLFHVNGSMPAEQRERIMRKFARASKAIMSNARCLTEGVDVPATDMVMFASPRESSIDIVQAIGRALRKHGSKKFGYVLLPVFVNQQDDETIDDACARTRHNYAWEVIQTLKEEDNCLETAVESAAAAYARTGDIDAGALSARVEIVGSHRDIGRLTRAITTTCIETTGSAFSEWLGLLLAYKDEYGHCRVPERCVFRDRKLGRWVRRIRAVHRNGVLAPDKVERLDAAGFVWEPWLADFARHLKRLEAYVAEHGHCMVPSDCVTDGVDLGAVVGRIRHRRELLAPEQVAALDRIGFVWSVFDKQFDEWCGRLSAYKAAHGDFCVPQPYVTEDGHRLGNWVSIVRTRRKQGRLGESKIAKLDRLGFEWDGYKTKFDAWVRRLAAFKDEFGTFEVPGDYETDDRAKLGYWVRSIRKRSHAGLLTHDQICKLEQIGFM